MGSPKHASADYYYRIPVLPIYKSYGGGDDPNTFDSIHANEQWVEEKNAPDVIIASELKNGKVMRTHLLCPYPQVPKHKGTGSTDDAASFMCSLP